MRDRAAAAMSGGVDSSAAACLLREGGWDVVGVTLRLFDGGTEKAAGEGACCSQDGVEDARSAARRLGIPHYVFDLKEEFRTRVMDPFAVGYQRGETPNPCIDCNRAVKFGALLRRAEELGWGKVATGHYVRLDFDAGSGRWLLKKAVHREKDQSYVLYSLTQDQLSRSLFPLGGLAKEEVRAIVADHGLANARKGESQDICFVPDGDYAAFIRRHTGREFAPGPFLDETGKALGVHRGIIGYTVGQRRGLGVSSSQGRLYVKEIRPADNAVVLSREGGLYARALTARQVNWIACARLDSPVRMSVRLRYHMEEQPCTVEQTGPDTLRVEFDRPQRAVTPGQAAVFYDGDTVVGGAVIEKGEP